MTNSISCWFLTFYTGKMPGPNWSLTRQNRFQKLIWRIYLKRKGIAPEAFSAFVCHTLAKQTKAKAEVTATDL